MAGVFWGADDEGHKHQFRWNKELHRTRRTSYGTTGQADILSSDHLNIGDILRLHLCANNPCDARWETSRYGMYGPPEHMQPCSPRECAAGSLDVSAASAAVAAEAAPGDASASFFAELASASPATASSACAAIVLSGASGSAASAAVPALAAATVVAEAAVAAKASASLATDASADFLENFLDDAEQVLANDDALLVPPSSPHMGKGANINPPGTLY